MVCELEPLGPRPDTVQPSEVETMIYAHLLMPDGSRRVVAGRLAGNQSERGPVTIRTGPDEAPITLAPETDAWHAARIALSGIELLAEHMPTIVQSTGEGRQKGTEGEDTMSAEHARAHRLRGRAAKRRA